MAGQSSLGRASPGRAWAQPVPSVAAAMLGNPPAGALFEFPNTVDGRIIRLVALQVRERQIIVTFVPAGGDAA